MSKYKTAVIRQQIDGLSYINEHIRLKKVGREYKGLCPFHGEKTPSFTVYPKGYINIKTKVAQDYATFYCFGCGVTGDVISFKKLKDDLETREEACDRLIEEKGLEIEDDNSQMEYLKEKYSSIINSYGNLLSSTEINLICSSICRNHLLWVKEYFNNFYNSEKELIEKYYRCIDNLLLERSDLEAITLIDEVMSKINKRKLSLKGEIK